MSFFTFLESELYYNALLSYSVDYRYIGCFAYGDDGTALSRDFRTGYEVDTDTAVEDCIEVCITYEYTLAGKEVRHKHIPLCKYMWHS